MPNHFDNPIYKRIILESINQEKEMGLFWQNVTLISKNLAQKSPKENIAECIYNSIISIPSYSETDRICIARKIANTNQLEIVDVYNRNGIYGRMVPGYRCFVNPTGSLTQLKDGQARVFNSAETVLESYILSKKSPQRSIRLISELGYKSGLCVPLFYKGECRGYFFLNSQKEDYFSKLDFQQLAVLTCISLTIKTEVLGANDLYQDLPRESTHGQAFDMNLFTNRLNEMIKLDNGQSITVAAEGSRFLYTPENLIHYLKYHLSTFFDLGHRISISFTSNNTAGVQIQIEGESTVFLPLHKEFCEAIARIYGFKIESPNKIAFELDEASNDLSINYSI